MKKVVLISGKAGVGKDTLASKVKEALLQPVLIIHFADLLKSIIHSGLLKVYGAVPEKDLKIRKLYQDVGSSFRDYDENFFANHVLKLIDILDTDKFIIPDWRFWNEYKVLENNKDLKILSVRIFAPHRESLTSSPLYHHESENSLPDEPHYYDIFVTDDNYNQSIKKIVKFLK